MADEIMLRDADILNTNFCFDDKIEVATKVATSLQKVIEDQKLAVPIETKKGINMYVTAEGWEVLGTMLGCTPYVEEVVEIPTQGPKFQYKATVSIRQGETILSRASAMAERNNMQKDRPSVYSMAQTRALGKSYRMALSWIIKMAGYEPTPAEEMPYTNHKPTAKELHEKKQQKEKEEREMESEPVEAEIVEPRYKPRTIDANNDMQIPDPAPLKTMCNQIIQQLQKRGHEVTKPNMKVRARMAAKNKTIDQKTLEQLLHYIDKYCPEEELE